MNKKITLLMMAAAVISTPLARSESKTENKTTTAEAQSDGIDEKIFELDPVVVTGNGHRQMLKSTTTPVHVLSKALINEAGVTDFQDAMSRLMPQISFSPNAMGSYIRVNGLGNKYVLILINGKKVIGDISGNVDLNRINMSNVKRIEVLDGAASALYGSDAIGGVINIITDQPVEDLIKATSNTRVSGKGQWSQGVNLDIATKYVDSHTSFFHEEADSYQLSDKEMDSDGNVTTTIDVDYIGYTSNVVGQHFDFRPLKNLTLYAGGQYNYKMTDRPLPVEGQNGGYYYDMRYEGWRWNAGAKYMLGKHELQLDFVGDDYRSGNKYKADYNSYKLGDYARTKRQKYYEGELKGVFHFYNNATTIIGADWRKDYLNATNGDVDNSVNTFAAYVQHDTKIFDDLSATVGLRYTHHEAFGNNFTPKVSLMYSPGNFRIRASYSRGFRAPGLDELYYHYFKLMGKRPVITFGNKDLDAEQSHYASFSVQYTNNIFSISVMGYLNFVKDMIVKETITVDDAIRAELSKEFPEITEAQMANLKTYGRYVNSDKGIVKGIQVNASVNITRDLSLLANYAYTYGQSRSAGVWKTLERTYKNSGTAALNYRHTWGGFYTLNANVNGRFQSRTYYPDYEDAPGYGVVNVNTTHTFKIGRMLDLIPSIGVDNIFNKVDDRISTTNIRHALYSPGRMLVVGLKINFNK